MKKILITISCFIVVFSATAQPNNLNEEKVKKAVVLMKKMMTNPGEMQTVMTELQALKLNSAENKEAKLRIHQQAVAKAGNIKAEVMNKGGITKKQITDLKENKDRIVPIRDNARINALLKRTLTDAEIKDFCKAVFEAVKKEFHPSVISQSEKIYEDLKTKKINYNELGNGAISCYLTNLTKHSLYIYGKICSEDATNGNNLNNYAALLTMQGVEQGSIPVLNYLNKRYARSPYVWSNLSVAWLGLGDLKTAEKYADSCIRFFPGHAAQAHYVKSVVKEREGDKEKAVEELQISIELGYTREKEMQLRKKNKKPENLLAKFRSEIPVDVMGLGRFQPPTIPRTYSDALVSATEWKSYYATLGAEYELLVKKTEEQLKSMGKTAMNYMVNKISELNSNDPVNTFAAANITNQRMQKNNDLLVDEFTPKEESFFRRMEKLQENKKLWKDEMEKEEEQINKKYENFCGEGKSCPEMEICNAYLANVDKYMTRINIQYEKYFSDYLTFKKQEFNELIYAAHFYMGKELFEYEKNMRKMLFLGAMLSVIYEFPSWALKPTNCIDNTPVERKWTLPSFKEINCFGSLQLDFPLFSMTGCDHFKANMKLVTELDKMGEYTGPWTDGSIITDEDLAPIKPIKKTTSINSKDDEKLAPITPIKRIEFDRSGFTDFQPAPGINSNPGAVGKNILLAGKPSFEIKAELKQVTINY